ncbi:MAG: hypothetical protein JOY58_19165 [Solirubrobacterales bacterium]|nr:hypothetical protein [Solirubrobacterales bacterium]MBV9050396.1 hypothetical protein [Solirubrobacterales bacterium]
MTPLQAAWKHWEVVAAVLAAAGLAWWWTVERMGPRIHSLVTATVLIVLAAGVFLAPHQVPGVVVPGSGASTR